MALVELARFTSSITAELARGFLESYGIGSVVFDSGMNAAESVPIMIPARVMVLDEDLEEARMLLQQADMK